MKLKRLAAVLAATSLCTMPAAFAENTNIMPETLTMNSNIGNFNQLTNIWSYSFGAGGSGTDTTINPVVVMDGVDANLVNVITNIVNIECNIDLSDIPQMIESMRLGIMNYNW